MAQWKYEIYEVPGSSPWWFLLKCLLLICFYRTKWCVQTLPRRYHTHSGIGNRMVWLSRAHILNLRYTGIRPNAWFWPKSVPNVYQGWRDLVPYPYRRPLVSSSLPGSAMHPAECIWCLPFRFKATAQWKDIVHVGCYDMLTYVGVIRPSWGILYRIICCCVPSYWTSAKRPRWQGAKRWICNKYRWIVTWLCPRS